MVLMVLLDMKVINLRLVRGTYFFVKFLEKLV